MSALAANPATDNTLAELERCCRLELAQRPDDAEALSLLGMALQKQGRADEALAVSQRAATLAPRNWLAHYTAAQCLATSAQVGAAIVHLREASAIDPRHRECAQLFIALLLAHEGIDDAAEALLAHRQHTGQSTMLHLGEVHGILEWAQHHGAPANILGECEEIPFVEPLVWGQAAAPRARAAVIGNTPFVAELSEALVFSNSGLILMPDGSILHDCGGHPEYGHLVDYKYETAVALQAPRKLLLDLAHYEFHQIDGGIWLGGLASNGYGHWLPEFLPKLQCLQQHPDFAALPIIVDADMPASHFEHLARLAGNPLLRLPKGAAFRCSRLLVAPSPTFYPVRLFPNQLPPNRTGALSPRAMRFIRDAARPTQPTAQGPERVFLGRRDMQWRRLANEAEISAWLATQGFVTIYPENLSLAEQIALFRSARYLVTPNGSALLNLMFAEPGIKVLVLSQAQLFNWGNFQGPMEAMGHEPLFLCGPASETGSAKHDDYHIPLASLQQALADMGLPGVSRP
ncbi:MAG: glycosyltransferase 61 family protein [Rhodocyclaceae bacterium]